MSQSAKFTKSTPGNGQSGSYKPPHTRRNGYNNRNRSESQFHPSTSSNLPIDPDVAEKRRLRFANDKKKEDESFGLVSRGEDNRLQRDPKARVTFFKQIQQSVCYFGDTFNM